MLTASLFQQNQSLFQHDTSYPRLSTHVSSNVFESIWRWYGSWAGYILHPDVDLGGRNSIYTRIKAYPPPPPSPPPPSPPLPSPPPPSHPDFGWNLCIKFSLFSGTWVDLEGFYHSLQRIYKTKPGKGKTPPKSISKCCLVEDIALPMQGCIKKIKITPSKYISVSGSC